MEQYLLYIKLIPIAEIQIIFYSLASILMILLVIKEGRQLVSNLFRPVKTSYRKTKSWYKDKKTDKTKLPNMEIKQ